MRALCRVVVLLVILPISVWAQTQPPATMPPEAHSALGKALDFQLRGEYERAIPGFERVLRLAPETRDVLYQLAVCSYNLKDLPTAKKYAEESIRRGEMEADSHNLLGVIEGTEGRKEAALSEFRKAVELNPSSDQYPFNISETLRELGRNEEAIPWVERAVKAKPQEPLYAFKLRLARLAAGKLGNLRREIEEQLVLDTPTGDWLLLSAAVQLSEKNSGRAVSLMSEARVAMSAPVFFGMIQDPYFVAWRTDPEVDKFYQVEILQQSAEGRQQEEQTESLPVVTP